MPRQDAAVVDNQSALDAAVDWGRLTFARLTRAKKWVIIYLVSGAAIGTAVALVIPNQYTSTTTFIARGSTSLTLPAALQGAAATLGLERGSDYSPKFYADLLTSRPVLRSASLHKYQVPGNDGSGLETYLQIQAFDHDPPSLALERAIKDLGERIGANADVRTNIITVSVRARYPELSRDIARALLAALDSLNLGFRQSQSRESREFYETRVLQSRNELDSADAAVRNFLQQNRVANSPTLQFELQRLQREADLKRGVYGIVVQQYEQARLQEARNVPTLTILAEPFLPVKKSFPPRRLIVVLGTALGLVALWIQMSINDAILRPRDDEAEN